MATVESVVATRDREALHRLVESVRAGRGGALVVRGERGVGKTALIERALAAAPDVRVLHVVGVESEMDLPYAALHQLCGPMLDRLGALPAPQRDALGRSFGREVGAAPDRFLVGLATLGLLAGTARQRPLVCVVDDAQWLDLASARTLAFVARRLDEEPVAIAIGARETPEELAGLPELAVEGLADAEARALLATAVRGPLDERVRDRIVAESRGNPLAIREVASTLRPAEVAGGFGLPGAPPLPARIRERFRRRLEPLPAETRLLLLVAAAEPLGEPTLLWRAAERLRLGPEAAAPAEAEGLIELGAQVRFRHPLMRSAVYRAAPLGDRRQVHWALAEATDRELDPDRHAWHRAQATLEPDEGLAADLERSSDRASARSGLAADAAFMENAARLTADPGRRALRALTAAEAKREVGAPGAALALLAAAEAGPLDELGRARGERLRAGIELDVRHGAAAPPLLLRAAKRLEALDPRLARETYLEALGGAIVAGRLADPEALSEIARAALAAPAVPEPRPADLLLDGLAALLTDGQGAGRPALRRAVDAFLAPPGPGAREVRWLGLAWYAAKALMDEEALHALAERHVTLARQAGALASLPTALSHQAGLSVHTGDFPAAAALVEEADAVARATGNAGTAHGRLALAAWGGDEERTLALTDAVVHDATARGEGMTLTVADCTTAVLENGHGRYAAALEAARRADEHDPHGLCSSVLVELVEAAARAGEPAVARAALARLSKRARATGTPLALGSEARSRALLSEGPAAEEAYREAIEQLGRSRSAAHLARARLLYGEWLRRERRRLDARRELRAAQAMLEEMGAEAFAARAARELLATGERARKRTPGPSDELTAQEAQVARMASEGRSNPQIAAQLFISPRTVEYHLTKVFAKLGIGSRIELARALAPAASGPSGDAPRVGRPRLEALLRD